MADTPTALPAGTVTFLLTDIQRSTALWEQHPDEMGRAVQRHEALIASATSHSEGILVRSKGEGDSCFCVFTRARDAVAAALQAQLALATEPWPGLHIAVRMAIHTGTAELREGQYYGTVVNRCARLRGIGHGAQTLVSSSTEALVRDALPEGATLRDLGAHRLPDLTQPERVYQLCHPGLPDIFPALNSLDEYPNNLPVQLTRFVGREGELATLEQLLSENRLVTITGPGGAGKTRLSLQGAANLLADFPDGVWFVSLAAVADPALVAAQTASVLGVREEPNRDLAATIADYLRDRRALLILDNCEHILRGAAELAAALLARCRSLKIVATSRQALRIEGEIARPLRPLSVPHDDASSVDELLAYEGVQLLADRAGLARAGFTVTAQNASAVGQICRRLDGIPLAIELAAARLGSLGPSELARRLDDRFRLLASGRRGGPARHETLDAAVDWSYELCDDDERLMFRRLAVFAGRFTLDTAESVCGHSDLEGSDAASLLARLVDRSLVYADAGDEAVTYRMLQTIRSVALTRLQASGEEPLLRSRHLDWLLDLAERADAHILGAEQARWLGIVEAHHDDVRAALEWALEADPSRALCLAAALGSFWDARGHWTEGRRWLEAALAVAQHTDPHLPRALGRAGNLAFEQGDYGTARVLLGRSLALHRESGDETATAHVLSQLADLEIAVGNTAEARELFDEAIAVSDGVGGRRAAGTAINLAMAAQALGDPLAESLYHEALTKSRHGGHKRGIAGALVGLGTMAQTRGDLVEARLMHEEALALFRELEDKFGTAETLSSLAAINRSSGQTESVADLLWEALPLYRGLGDRRGIARTLVRLGVDDSTTADPARATELLSEALDVFRELGDTPGVVAALTYLARAARSGGDKYRAAVLCEEALDWCAHAPFHRSTATCLEELAGLQVDKAPEGAAQIFGAAEALREAVGAAGRSGQTGYERDVEALVSSLGEDRFAAAWNEGRAMSPEDAVACARKAALRD